MSESTKNREQGREAEEVALGLQLVIYTHTGYMHIGNYLSNSSLDGPLEWSLKNSNYLLA